MNNEPSFLFTDFAVASAPSRKTLMAAGMRFTMRQWIFHSTFQYKNICKLFHSRALLFGEQLQIKPQQHHHEQQKLSAQKSKGTTEQTLQTSTSQATEEIGSPAILPGAVSFEVTVAHIKQAYARIQHFVPKTPLDSSPKLARMTKCAELYLKKEHLSTTGSYKERGALNKILSLTPEQRARGVICASAGNHAQGVAFSSQRLGIDAKICMPYTTPHVKVAATREFGGQVVLHGESFGEAFEHSLTLAREEGRTFVHAFNDSEVVSGQGTIGLELLQQNALIDAIVLPIGGGGLAAGVATFVKNVNPRIKIYGVETSAMPGMLQSIQLGRVTPVQKRLTISDGIAVETVGQVPFQLIQKYVDDIVTVDEDEIAAAVLALLEQEKTLVEGSGATALAALLFNKLPVKDQVVACILSGGNIDMTLLSRLIDKGLAKSGRLARIRVTVPDSPGNLARVLTTISLLRANIREVAHERAFLLSNVSYSQPIITFETRGPEHVQEIVEKIRGELAFPVAVDTPHD